MLVGTTIYSTYFSKRAPALNSDILDKGQKKALIVDIALISICALITTLYIISNQHGLSQFSAIGATGASVSGAIGGLLLVMTCSVMIFLRQKQINQIKQQSNPNSLPPSENPSVVQQKVKVTIEDPWHSSWIKHKESDLHGKPPHEKTKETIDDPLPIAVLPTTKKTENAVRDEGHAMPGTEVAEQRLKATRPEEPRLFSLKRREKSLINSAHRDVTTSEKEIMEQHSRFTLLSEEMILHIFQYLSPRTLCTASLVCKDWYRLSGDNVIWKQLFETKFDSVKITTQSEMIEYKSEYKKQILSIEKQKLQKSFNELIIIYPSTIRSTTGCGSRGQIYIDSAWEKLNAFANAHPEFRSRVPEKTICSNDGFGGFASGFSNFGGW